MNTDLDRLKAVRCKLCDFKTAKSTNLLKFDYLKKENLRLDKETKRINNKIKILESEKEKTNIIPEKISKKIKGVLFTFSSSIVVSTIISAVALVSGFYNVLSIYAFFTIISTLFASKNIYEIIKLKKDLKYNNIDDIQKEIDDLNFKKESKLHKQISNKEQLNVLSIELDNIEESINSILINIINIREIQNKIIEDLFNEEDAIHYINETLNSEGKEKIKQKK